MKNHFIYLILLMIIFIPDKMQAQDCFAANSAIDLDVNNVRARLLGGGDMWWDLSEGRYIVPKVSPGEREVSAIFAAGLWMGGYDAGDNLRLAAQTYRQSGNDFWPGPIDDDVTTEQMTCQNWDNHWEIRIQEIFNHIIDYIDNNQIDNQVPNSIMGWPGRNNPHFQTVNGFDLPSDKDFAPFVDIDLDGIYDPMQGDYPRVKGDQAIWWIFNDVGDMHSESGGGQLGVEIGAMAYAYNSTTPEALYNTTFYEYTIRNKGTEVINDFYIGLFADVDLGCYSNDYVGCDTLRNMGFVYNGTANDPNCDGVNGYGNNIPLLGIQMLEGPKNSEGIPQDMSAFVAYNNNINPNNNTNTTNPDNAQHFYNYLSGFWKDDTPVEYGGNGYMQGTYPTPFMYPSAPNDNSFGTWSESKEGNDPDDRRFVMSVGPGVLEPNSVQRMAFSAIWVPNVPHPNPDITPLQSAADDIKMFYDSLLVVSNQVPIYSTASVQVIPNPMFQQSILKINSKEMVEHVQLYSADGRLQRTYPKPNDNTLTIERGTLPTGMYFYKISFENGQIKSGKLLMQ